MRLGASTLVWDGSDALEECPSDALRVHVVRHERRVLSRGLLRVLHVESDGQSAAVPLQGTGVMCLYQNECDTLSAACGVNFTFIEFGITCGYLTGFFALLWPSRQHPADLYMLHTCDPNLYMEPENPRYPPFRVPPKHFPGLFGWLRRAWA